MGDYLQVVNDLFGFNCKADTRDRTSSMHARSFDTLQSYYWSYGRPAKLVVFIDDDLYNRLSPGQKKMYLIYVEVFKKEMRERQLKRYYTYASYEQWDKQVPKAMSIGQRRQYYINQMDLYANQLMYRMKGDVIFLRTTATFMHQLTRLLRCPNRLIGKYPIIPFVVAMIKTRPRKWDGRNPLENPNILSKMNAEKYKGLYL